MPEPDASASNTPLSDEEFARLMAPFAPFEDAPVLAVGVSGGGDSMALTRLAAAWARRRGGRAVGLTVDHGLRAESATEAQRVAGWLRSIGVEHRTLPWEGRKPASRLQEEARQARYRLLRDWCRAAGVLHLLLAHTRDDQAETVLMRGAHGSTRFGLTGMSAVVAFPEVRLLRPLLAIPRQRLRATLQRDGQPWIEDPSNRDPRFDRVVARDELDRTPGRGKDLIAASLGHGEARIALEAKVARLAASCCGLRPQGYALIARPALAAVDGEVRARFLAGLLAAVGGRAYPPEPVGTTELAEWLAGPDRAGRRTLSGCVVAVRGDEALVCREMRGLPEPMPLRGRAFANWDLRFDMAFAEAACGRGDLMITPLGRDGWREVGAFARSRSRRLPWLACLPLPSIRDSRGLVEVPGMGYRRGDALGQGPVVRRAVFAPRNPLGGGGFCLASGISGIISLSSAHAEAASRRIELDAGACPLGKDLQ